MKNTKKKGFTIVELVIVIAVIGILSAILIPTFSNLVKDANDAAMQSNLRNAYTEYSSVAAANDDYLSQEDVVFAITEGTETTYYSYANGKYTVMTSTDAAAYSSATAISIVTDASTNPVTTVNTFNGYTAYEKV